MRDRILIFLVEFNGQSETCEIVVHFDLSYLLKWFSQTEGHADIDRLWDFSIFSLFFEVVIHSLAQNSCCVIVDRRIFGFAELFNVGNVEVDSVSAFLDARWWFSILDTIWRPTQFAKLDQIPHQNQG